ncbi:uncharacterized protein LOC133716672 [Rosa rugosa]|uniref:uncharacterized protein LOC133716672 n=1 Tax=Rosa rugosa TaxID=74645 RepID=UPI002B414411|nr:uncharacterized protein LOC133716672 [Rosa rugosa]
MSADSWETAPASPEEEVMSEAAAAAASSSSEEVVEDTNSDETQTTIASSSSSSAEKRQNLWFYAELNQVRLLQRALRPLFQTAYTDREYPDDMFLAGHIRDAGHVCISPDGILLICTTSFPPHLDAYLQLPLATFSAFRCRKERVLDLHLRLLENRINSTVDDYEDDDGISVCFSGAKPNYNALLYSLRDRDAVAVHSSEMALISSYQGSLAGLDWSDYSYIVSIEMPAQIFKELINSLSFYGFEVHADVTATRIMFRVVNKVVILEEGAERYRILRERGQYPFLLEFGLHHKSAFLNAASLSDRVRLHQLLDLRTVFEVPVNGLGSIMFCSRL